jgi:hypothetical protein
MKSSSLKPFDDGNYLSEEEALKLIEKIPIPKSPDSNKPTAEPQNIPEQENPSELISLEGRIITIDSSPADDNKVHTQDDWIKYFNDRNEIMVSMPDIYLAGKSNNKKLLHSLRKDFKDIWITSSTRIKYDDNQDARIIHNYNSKLIKQVEHNVVIPEYRPQYLENVLNTQEGLKYLQILFGTNDTAQQIKDTLQKLSNYSLDKTKVWSAALSDRSIERASGFYCDDGVFHVNGDLLCIDGRSRGVRISAAGASPKI